MAKKATTKKKETALRLEDVMMNCRNIMRGKTTMAVRRDIILTLVFMKFLDDRFTTRREEIKEQYKEDARFAMMACERAAEYGRVGVKFIPASCRWENVLNLDEATRALELDNMVAELNKIDGLQGALPGKIFTESKIDSKTLKQLAEEIDKIDIEFVDRDTNLDYDAILTDASAKTKEIIDRQIKNQEALRKAFAALGY